MSTELVAFMIELRPAALFAVVLSVLAYVILSVRMRKLDVRCRKSRETALFVGLEGRSLVHLAAAWVKFAFFAGTLLLAKEGTAMHRWMLLVLAAVVFLLHPGVKMLVNEAFSAALTLGGMAVGGVLLRYLREIRSDTGVRAVYWLLAVFLIAAAFAILVREVMVISAERNSFDETGEIE